MARHLRLEFPGAIYHVTCRMIGDAPAYRSAGTRWPPEKCLYRDDADRERFLDRLAERVEQYNIRLYLFVCMINHFHLVFETPEANCSKFMQSVLTAYTVYYNRRHGRHGHLFDGRFKAKLVEGDDYLLALSRYVHLNPVQTGGWKGKPLPERVKALRMYRWSSYPSYIGRRRTLDFVEYGPLLAEMGGRRGEWPKRFREFVESGLTESDPSSPGYDVTSEDFKEALEESPRCIGGDGFRAWIDELYQQRVERHGRLEDVSFRHITEPLLADEVLAILGEVFDVETEEFSCRRHASPLRAVAARFLIRYAGLSQREVAEALSIGSGAAVCNQLKSLPDRLAGNRRLRKQVKDADARLEKMKRMGRGDANTGPNN